MQPPRKKKRKIRHCPHCGKAFSSKSGLDYHIARKVCVGQDNGDADRVNVGEVSGATGIGNLNKDDLDKHSPVLDTKRNIGKRRIKSCPHCGKLFASRSGLINHLSKNVCQRQSTEAEGRSDGSKAGTLAPGSSEKSPLFEISSKAPERVDSCGDNAPDGCCDDLDDDMAKKRRLTKKKNRLPADRYCQLMPGSKFITRFGVVKVICDNRLPPDHHKSKVDSKAGMSYAKKLANFCRREKSVSDRISAGTRYRRAELTKMYMESLRKSSSGTTMLQKVVWDLYCESMSAQQLLIEGISWEHNNDDLKKIEKLGIDPRCPKDFYPDRIVECKLTTDRRAVIVKNFADETVMRHDASRKKALEGNKTASMRLFIARRELTREYNSSKPSYVCSNCGEDITGDRMQHLKNQICVAKKEFEEEERRQQVEATEQKALWGGAGCRSSLLKTQHGVKPYEIKLRSDPPEFGNPHRIKEHKKAKMPPWLVFNVQRSCMYPETYAALDFRRGSQNRNHYNKKKQEDGYLSKAEKCRLRKRIRKAKRMSLPQFSAGLSPGINTSEPSTKTTAHEFKGKRKVCVIDQLKLTHASGDGKVKAQSSDPKGNIPKQAEKDPGLRKTHPSPAENILKRKASEVEEKRTPESTQKKPDTGYSSQSPLPMPPLPPLPHFPSIDNQVDMVAHTRHNEGSDKAIFDTAPDSVCLEETSNHLNEINETNDDCKHADIESLPELDSCLKRPGSFANGVICDTPSGLVRHAKSDDINYAENTNDNFSPNFKREAVSDGPVLDAIPEPPTLDVASEGLNNAKKAICEREDTFDSSSSGKQGTASDDGHMFAKLPPSASDENNQSKEGALFSDNGVIFGTTSDSMPLDGTKNDLKNDKESNGSEKNTTAPKKKRRRRRRENLRYRTASKKKTVVIDTQVLATECESGRYPSVNRYYGDHDQHCTLCKEVGDMPLINCDFCRNSVHQHCLDKRMIDRSGTATNVFMRDSEPHDTPMCHDCVYLCLVRRSRAETRRLMKWEHELSKAGFEDAPQAINLPEEVNLNSTKDGLGGDDQPSYPACPVGGPGGLICCSDCTSAYSRFLSNTAKEMEAQAVANTGQEVNEILELLDDAKRRLQRASDISEINEARRGLLDKNQTGHLVSFSSSELK